MFHRLFFVLSFRERFFFTLCPSNVFYHLVCLGRDDAAVNISSSRCRVSAQYALRVSMVYLHEIELDVVYLGLGSINEHLLLI